MFAVPTDLDEHAAQLLALDNPPIQAMAELDDCCLRFVRTFAHPRIADAMERKMKREQGKDTN